MDTPETTDRTRRAGDARAAEGSSPRTSRRMPPLGWIVIAGLLVVLAFVYASWSGSYRTPSGGTAPSTTNQANANPGAPAGPGPAPAAPSSRG